MRPIVLTALLATFAATAVANEIRFYFSQQGNVTGVPNEYLTETNPTVQMGETVYLWAATIYPDIWVHVGIEFTSPAAGFDIAAGVLHNPFTKGWGQRWEDDSDFDPVPDHLVKLVSVTHHGIGSYGDPLAYEQAVGGGQYLMHSLLGNVAFDAGVAAEMRMSTVPGFKITLQNDLSDQTVYFGFGDAPVAPEGGVSALPDLYLVPEPATAALLVPMLFIFRRRQRQARSARRAEICGARPPSLTLFDRDYASDQDA